MDPNQLPELAPSCMAVPLAPGEWIVVERLLREAEDSELPAFPGFPCPDCLGPGCASCEGTGRSTEPTTGEVARRALARIDGERMHRRVGV